MGPGGAALSRRHARRDGRARDAGPDARGPPGRVPVVLAKLVSDVCVFTFGQLLLLRFFVFPVRRKLEAVARARAPHWGVAEPSLEEPVARVG